MRRAPLRSAAHRRAPDPAGRACADGFSLIEVLVALAIFSIAVIAHLHLQSENARTVAALEQRAYARIAAENRLAETLARSAVLEIGTESGESEIAGLRWAWTERISTTRDAGMLRVDVTVSDETTGQLLAEVSGFRGDL